MSCRRLLFATVGFFAAALLPAGAFAATQTVTSLLDSGTGTMRDAIAAAGPGDTIDATQVSGTITLSGSSLSIGNNLTVIGPGANLLAVSGDNSSAVFTITSGSAGVSGLTITGGSGAYGAGFANDNATLSVTSCAVSGNSSTNSGGGIYTSGGTTNITNSTVSSNHATVGGGGIYNTDGTTNVAGCAISGNSSGSGGGLDNFGVGSGSTMSVVNSTVAGNSATNGGGIYNYQVIGTANLTVVNCTIAGNPGGGIYNDEYEANAVLNIGDTILANGTSGGDLYQGATINSLGCNISDDSSGPSGATDKLNANPLLGPLQYNGGPTQTCALLPQSPAIDSGSNALAAAYSLTTDQRGFPRVINNTAPMNRPASATATPARKPPAPCRQACTPFMPMARKAATVTA
jgi:hypothetical protein